MANRVLVMAIAVADNPLLYSLPAPIFSIFSAQSIVSIVFLLPFPSMGCSSSLSPFYLMAPSLTHAPSSVHLLGRLSVYRAPLPRHSSPFHAIEPLLSFPFSTIDPLISSSFHHDQASLSSSFYHCRASFLFFTTIEPLLLLFSPPSSLSSTLFHHH